MRGYGGSHASRGRQPPGDPAENRHCRPVGPSQPEGNGVTITVEDNGAGVSPDMKGRIFPRGVGKNTGLELFLTREILTLTNITVDETGEPGHGARFELRVPKEGCRFTAQH
ncbi:MAG: ATP-binding protein [Methanoregula sp.]|nr:ATP-binding protein [Methanoregula sp.]